VGARGEIR